MAGTIDGGKQAAQTNKDKYGADFYVQLGRKGGLKGRTGGFYANRELARSAGTLGGTISRRGKNKLTPQERKIAKLRHVIRQMATGDTQE